MTNILSNLYWGIQFIVINVAVVTALIAENIAVYGNEVSQSESPQEEADIELTVIEKLLNQPVYSPFRREGTVKDATRPVYVITGEEMEAQGARNVREAMRFLPGILPDGLVGTEFQGLSSQFIRGSSSDQVLILLDGKPINDVGSGGFDLSEIPTNNIERIEVLPGGGSTLYGSGAIGGVINIITRSPTEKPTTDVKVSIGSYGLNQQSIQTRGKSGNIGWVLGYNRTQAEYDYPFSIPEANFEGTRENNDVIANNFNLKLQADINQRNSLTFSALYLGKEQGVPGGVPVPAAAFNSLTDNDRKYTDQVLTDVIWKSKLGNGEDSLLTARVYADFLNTRFENVSSQNRRDNQQDSYGVQVNHSWKFAQNQALVYGFDYRYVEAKNSTFNFVTNENTVSYDDSISKGEFSLDMKLILPPVFT